MTKRNYCTPRKAVKVFSLHMDHREADLECSDASALYERIPESCIIRDKNTLITLAEKSCQVDGFDAIARPGTAIRGLALPLGDRTLPGVLVLFYNFGEFSHGRFFSLDETEDLHLLAVADLIGSRHT